MGSARALGTEALETYQMKPRSSYEKQGETALKLPEILSALSFALDLTEGADPGHAVRSTLLGMRIGVALGLPQSKLASLYYALQLKDVGCSSNAARVAQLFGGDDREAKALSKLTDWTGLRDALGFGHGVRNRMLHLADGLRTVPQNAAALWRVVLPEGGVRDRLERLSELGKHSEGNLQEVIALRCDRGASILRKLEMSEAACEAVRHLDEHWDGSGYPDGLRGERIPLLARIAAVAQNLDVFATAQGIEPSLRTLQRRSGIWFDPELVRNVTALHRARVLWQDCEPGCPVEQSRQAAMQLSPDLAVEVGAAQIDTICAAFADVVDAKSPFTFRHSVGVAEVATALAKEMGMTSEQQHLLHRAALLHDLGKLGVPNSILDKRGALTKEERQVIVAHPLSSRTILSRISGFETLARIAGEHHERLDGSGYPHGLRAEQLTTESRLLAMADCFAALAEERPYRAALPLREVLSILKKDVPDQLDPTVFEAAQAVAQRWEHDLPQVFSPSTPQQPVCQMRPKEPHTETALVG